MSNSRCQPLYKDKEWLENQYFKNREQKEIAEEFGVSSTTIRYWAKKLNVDTRPKHKQKSWILPLIKSGKTYKQILKKTNIDKLTLQKSMEELGVRELYWDIHSIDPQKQTGENKYKKVNITEEKLRELFVRKWWTQEECAEYFDCHSVTIERRLKKYGINRYHRCAKMGTIPPRNDGLGSGGYEVWRVRTNSLNKEEAERKKIRVHRLLMVSEHGFEAVKNMDVHHKSITFDNRPEALELLSHSEHRKIEEWPDEEEIHDCPRDPNPKFTDREWLQEAMLRYGSVEKIAEVCDRDTSEIQHWVDWLGIQKHQNPLEA